MISYWFLTDSYYISHIYNSYVPYLMILQCLIKQLSYEIITLLKLHAYINAQTNDNC